MKYDELADRRSKSSESCENSWTKGAGPRKTQEYRTSIGNAARGARNLTGGAGSTLQIITKVKKSHTGRRVAKALKPRHAVISPNAKPSL
jgi:hypothetical protein